METIVIAIIVFACLICLFSVCFITYDFIVTNKEYRKIKKINEENDLKLKAKNEAIANAKIIEPVNEDIQTIDENIISFSMEKKETFKEKYLKLDSVTKGYCDEIISKALLVKDAKKRESTNHIDIRVGKFPVVKILIKRDVLTCEFYFSNFEFKNYSRLNGVRYKPAPTIIRVIDKASYLGVLATIDIASKAIDDEKEYLRAIKRKEKQSA